MGINVIAIFVAFGYFLFVAQYFQLVLDMAPMQAGAAMAPSSVGFIIGSQAAPRIVRMVRPAYLIGAGMVLAAMGLGILTRLSAHGGPVPPVNSPADTGTSVRALRPVRLNPGRGRSGRPSPRPGPRS
ncbi:hypothetical protein ACIRRA_04525 [Nocardia sp. NPDC101769]|uniref:hypothetical protein n=1 Tax=Nocardia sp. NPDC101769 TaxID=3364333 RepID=UPI0038293E48